MGEGGWGAGIPDYNFKNLRKVVVGESELGE